MKNSKIKQAGFTLIELILVVGLISLITSGLYITYNKKRMDANVTLQSEYLERIEKHLDSLFINSNDFSTINNTFANNFVSVPTELKTGATTFKNLLGGDMNFIYVPKATLGFDGYTIQLTKLSSEACTKIATSKFGYNVPLVRVNNNPMKTISTQFTGVNIANITTACSTTNNNTVDFSSFPNNLTNLADPNTATSRQNNNIPAVGDIVTSSTPACTGGSTWNNNACACPVGKIWTGTTCENVNTTFRSCIPGTGWDGSACSPLPATKSTFLRYSTPPVGANPTSISPTVAGSVSAPAAGYVDLVGTRRYLPSVPTPPISMYVQTPQQTDVNCSASGGHWDGRVCNYCSDATTTVIKDSANNTVTPTPAIKSVKSTWDGYRCVTPSTGW